MPTRAAAPHNETAPLVAFERRVNLRRQSDVTEARKRAFLRVASHELRTPLNAIVGFSEIIAGELYGPLGAPQYKEYAEHVQASGYRLLRLINQVIDIVRLDGQVADLDVRREPLDIAIADAIEAVRSESALQNTDFLLETGENCPPVMADARGLRTTLVNMLQVAAGRAPQGAPVRVRVARYLSRVEIEVEDAGEAVEAATLPRLLDPFDGEHGPLAALDNEGLGLAIARLHCAAMSGGLKLRAPPRGGLIATAWLPAG